MVEQTPRLALDDYSPGDTDWDHSDLVLLVDELAIDRGPIADRPASGEYPDQLYYATDQNVLWGWDDTNSQWVIRGGTGSSSQPLDSVATETATINSRSRNADLTVRIATDDGSQVEILEGADNERLASFGSGSLGSELQTVLNNWSHAEGDDRLHIHFGTGNYTFHDGVTFDNGSLFATGEGRNNTKLIAGSNLAAGADVFEITGSGKIFDFRDFKMTGNRGGGVDATGIRFTGGAEFIFHGVEVRSFARKNIWFDGVTSGGWNGMYDTWSLDPGDVGVYIDGGSSSAFQEIAIEGCKLKNEGGGTHALYAHEVRDINIVGGHITGADAVNFDRVIRGRISDVQFKDLSGTYAIALGNGVAGDLAERITITDNYFTDGPTNGIQLNATADRNTIVDNRFWAVSGESTMEPVAGTGNDGHLVIRDNTPTVEVDVRNIYAFNGARAHHDGSGTNTAGPAFYNGADWVSLVDGTTIA